MTASSRRLQQATNKPSLSTGRSPARQSDNRRGTLNFKSNFNQNVAFIGTRGELELARSQSYTATITGFSTSGGTSLDLRDIGFVSANEATFNGTSTSGVLTVSDGTHAAHITLDGDYLASTFTCSSDGNGGVLVTDFFGRGSGHRSSLSRHPARFRVGDRGPRPDPRLDRPAEPGPWRERRPCSPSREASRSEAQSCRLALPRRRLRRPPASRRPTLAID